jgi:hypothetical protein
MLYHTHTPFHLSFARSRNFGRFDPPKSNIYIVVRRASEITSRPSDSRLGGLEMRFGDRFRSDRERTPDSGEYFLEWGGGLPLPFACQCKYIVHIRGGGGSNLFSNSNPNLSMKARQTYPDNPIITGWGSSISLTWNVRYRRDQSPGVGVEECGTIWKTPGSHIRMFYMSVT